MEQTLYEQFGVKETATTYEIKRAYRKLAFKYHPDRNGGDKKFETLFKQINSIYQILSDEDLRRKYDAELKWRREAKRTRTTVTTSNTTQRQQTTYKETRKTQAPPKENPIRDDFGILFVGIILLFVFGYYLVVKPTINDNLNPDSLNQKTIPYREQTGEIDFSSKQTTDVVIDINPNDSVSLAGDKPKSDIQLVERKDTAYNSYSTGEIKF